ncbi:MAG: FAD-dependent oxidoreductase [Lentisphaeria bacterium]|nr:FAD-dependent oxidoreductase [Lentisphaeria bacterium]
MTARAAAGGPLAAWSFDVFEGDLVPGVSGAKDALVVQAARRVKGVRGTALELDGRRSAARCVLEPGPALGDSLTVEAWVRFDPADLRGFRTVVRKEGCYALRFHDKSLGLVLWQQGKAEVYTAERRHWPAGEWVHVGAVYDGGAVRLYVNGVADPEPGFPLSGAIDDAPTALLVGSNGRTHVFCGAIDEVRIHDRPLSPADLRARRQEGLAASRAEADIPVEPEPVGAKPALFPKPKREITMVREGTLWIEAEEFAEYGGWLLDTQYVHLMGSAYLIAAGIGVPVADATTECSVPAAGEYHVWVRARNWLVAQAPGRFRVLVNGQPLASELGAAETDAWVWEQAGTVSLPAGRATLALRDLTGYYGRCDALVLTSDAGYRPPEEVEALARERARLTGVPWAPRHGGDYDVVVVGGGPAGGPAAIAAARMGMRTLLIQDRPLLGGNGSDELGVGFNGASAHHADARETGIIEELGRIRARYHHPRFSDAFRMLCEREKDLTVLLNTRVVGVEMASPVRIGKVAAVDTLNGTRSTFGGRMVIDCTGDGWVGVFAGADHRYGREARGEFQEDLAPEQADGITMSGCLMYQCCGYRAADMGRPVPYTPPPWAPRFPDAAAFGRNPRRFTSGEWWLEHPGTIDDMRDGERARDELLRITFGYWDYIKNVWPEREKARNYALEVVPVTVGRREGCRLLGDVILTQNDVQAARVFPDRIAYGGWPLDVHHPLGVYSGREGPFDCNPRVPVYTIPYRCLYSRNIENLFFAGRNISVTHIALGTVRVQSTLATCGQAAGTAAAMCLQRGLSPRELGERQIGDLQQRLLRMDQSIPGIRNQDPADLALKATVAASSEMSHSRFRRSDVHSAEAFELTTSRGMSFRVPPEGRVDAVFVLLESRRPDPTPLTLGLREGQAGADFAAAADVAAATATVPANGRHWVRFAFGQPLRAPFAWVWLPRTEGIHWVLMTHAPRGSHRAWGLKPEGGAEAVVSGQYMALYTEPNTGDAAEFRAAFVTNGLTRPGETDTNLWASDPEEALPQWIELRWAKAVTIGAVSVTFDTDMNNRWHDVALVPQCARNYEVAVPRGDAWQTVVTETENFQRHRQHRFAPVTTDRLRLTVSATHGDASACVYEIRAYEE